MLFYRRYLCALLSLAAAPSIVSLRANLSAAAILPAFPGAEGFGAVATGGRGGEIYVVTNLEDSGPGSLRDAVSKPHRMIVFAVSGIIRARKTLELSSDLTLAGESAPGEGICVYGAGVSISHQSNIIIRYLRFRGGIESDRGKKALGMDSSERVMVDHCSIEWGRWDDLGITVKSHDITVQHCLIAEGIDPQSFGALVDSVERVTLSRNLWMNNESRNPKAKGTIQYINNVVYNWKITGLCGGHSASDHWLDVIGNVFVKGPSSNDQFAGQFLKTDHVYQRDNLADLNCDGKFDGRPVREEEFSTSDRGPYTLPTFVSKPALQPAISVTTLPAAEACQRVLAEVGCSLRRDSVDRRLIEEASSFGTKGSTIDHKNPAGEALVGGIGVIASVEPPVDSDRDGIPNDWEKEHGLNPNDQKDAGELAGSGYSHLEEYLHSRATRHLGN